jgi:hypothetical protein
MDSLVIVHEHDNEFTATLTVMHRDSLATYTRTFTVERDPERYNRWALIGVALSVFGPDQLQLDGWEADARSLDGP